MDWTNWQVNIEQLVNHFFAFANIIYLKKRINKNELYEICKESYSSEKDNIFNYSDTWKNTSLPALLKLCLIKEIDKEVCLTEIGRQILTREIDLIEGLRRQIIEYQYYNPYTKNGKGAVEKNNLFPYWLLLKFLYELETINELEAKYLILKISTYEIEEYKKIIEIILESRKAEEQEKYFKDKGIKSSEKVKAWQYERNIMEWTGLCEVNGKTLSLNQEKLEEIKNIVEKIPEFLDLELKEWQDLKGRKFKKNSNIKKINNLSYQKIVYGAPGTGKSYNLQKEIEENFRKDNIKRVTFYDGYTYGQFVGAYKPVMYKNDNDKKEIGYEFVAGPLLQKILNAYKYPEQNFIIVIEEINRAKADRVFGDIFQLLDRNSEGESEYSIALSREQENYFEENLDEIRYLETIVRKKGLYLPNNLYIWATMNSADQGVYPMDTAFKRRWSFKYTPLNDLKTEYKIRVDGELYNWDIYRNLLNDTLGENGITEDRLIAPFFLKDEDFDQVTKELKEEIYLNKFLMYLFEDILKHNKRLKTLIFDDKNLSFYKIFSNIKNNNIYSKDFKSSLIEKSKSETKEE